MNPKTFCAIAWAQTRFNTRGGMHPCCKIDINWAGSKNINDVVDFDQYWNSDQMRQLRLEHLQGHKSDPCQVCWNDEAAGKSSLRQEYNKQFAKYLNLNEIKKTTTGHSSDYPVLLDLNLSNICNYKCVMCNPALSSKIAQEQQQHQDRFQALGFIKTSNIVNQGWPEEEKFSTFMEQVAPGLKCMELKGGEPLLIKQVKKTIQNIENKSECTIALTTNGSVEFEEDFLEILSEFKQTWIFISVDGIGHLGEWVRYGSDWSQVETTIQKISTLKNCTFRLSTVLQFFSPVTFPGIFSFSKKHGYDIEILQCVNPDYLSINAIPPEKSQEFQRWVQDQQKEYPNDSILKIIDGYFNSYQYQPDLFEKCQKYVSTLDQIRNNQCQDIQSLFQ